MFKKVFFPSILVVLIYGFWISPNFKEIAAGVAIFLFGMLSLDEGFRAFTGGILEKILKKSTDKMWKSLTFGFSAATIMQSSSLVSVITISFLSAGLIGLVEGLGIVFGANVGTTTGAWLIAGFGLKVKISEYAMPMLVFGVIFIFRNSKNFRGIGYILVGLGFLFLGIHHMKEGFETFQNQIDLTEFAISGVMGVIVFTFVGIVATIIMQSSHATLVLIITALSVQQVTYENALALAIGANVGTTITAVLGSLTSNADGRRLAMADVLFKVAAGILFMAFITPITSLVDIISEGVGIAPGDYTLKLAVFHTIFNITGVIIMVPLISHLINLVSRIIPDKNIPSAEARYLNDSSLELSDTALEAIRKETVHLYENAFKVIAHGLAIKPDDITSDLELSEIITKDTKPITIDIDDEYQKQIKKLYSEIMVYTSQAASIIKPEYLDELFSLQKAGQDIVQAIKDTKHMQKNLSRFIISDNESIREEYNTIREGIASVLRRLELAKTSDDSTQSFISLEVIKLEIEEYDKNVNNKLVTMIQDNSITPEMATSLMNDVAYAYDITYNLVKMGEAIFIRGDLMTRESLREMSLEESEVEDALSH